MGITHTRKTLHKPRIVHSAEVLPAGIPGERDDVDTEARGDLVVPNSGALTSKTTIGQYRRILQLDSGNIVRVGDVEAGDVDMALAAPTYFFWSLLGVERMRWQRIANGLQIGPLIRSTDIVRLAAYDGASVQTCADLTNGELDLERARIGGYLNDSEGKSIVPVNRVKGITPTISGWDTDPTNLGKATDEDWTTVTTTGQKVLAGSGDVGMLTIDMGAIYSIQVRAKLGLWSTAGYLNCLFSYSDNGSTWYYLSNQPIAGEARGTEWIAFTLVAFARCRYIRLHFTASDAGTFNVKIYEVQAIEHPNVSGVN